MYECFFLANTEAHPWSPVASDNGISMKLEHLFVHFDDFSIRNWYNADRIREINCEKKYLIYPMDMPRNYNIKLHFKQINDLNDKDDTFLVLCNFLDGQIDDELLAQYIKKARIPYKKVIIVTNNYAYVNYKNYGMPYIYVDFWESFTRYHQKFLPDATSKREVTLKASKKFLCLNRNIKSHRIWFYFVMHRLNAIENNYVSYHLPNIDNEHYNSATRSGLVTKYIPNSLMEEYRQFLNKTRPGQKLDKISSTDAINYQTGIKKYYEDSLFSIITESDFRDTFLTEKTFKAIVHCHPFFIIGNKQHHALLRENGYHTFEDLFDIECVHNFDQAGELITKVNNTSIKEYTRRISENHTDKLLHNYDNFFNRKISWNSIVKKIINVTR